MYATPEKYNMCHNDQHAVQSNVGWYEGMCTKYETSKDQDVAWMCGKAD